MKLGYNPTLKQARLEDELIYCEKYRFDAVELRIEKLKDYFTRHSLNDLKNFFEQSSLKPLSLNAVEQVLFADKETRRQNAEDLEYLCSIGQELNIRDIVIVPSFHEAQYTMDEIKEESVNVLQKLYQKAEKFGMRLAYEFVGNPKACVNDFQQCYDIVQATNCENIGISLDFFHFYAMKSNPEDLKKADIEKIFLVHIDDADFFPPGSLREEQDRLFPGDGAIPVRLYMEILKSKGYAGLVSVELFRPEYNTWDIETYIKMAKEKSEVFLRS